MAWQSGGRHLSYAARVRQQERTGAKWASLWRSIILSSLDETLYMYCHSIRELNLQDLEMLFEDFRFRGKVEKAFFAGPLARFNIPDRGFQSLQKPVVKRLNIAAALEGIGEVLTQKTPLLEHFRGKVDPSALARWASRLPRLQILDLWNGDALTEADNVDQKLANFLNGLRPHSLQSFEILSASNIAVESFSALSKHRESLQELRLSTSKRDAILALPLMQQATVLKTLYLEDGEFFGFEWSESASFQGVADWFRQCSSLSDLTLNRFKTGPAILIHMLRNNDIRLRKLDVSGYDDMSGIEFHQALGDQISLQELKLGGDDGYGGLSQEVLDGLVDSLCRLTNLRVLELRSVADHFVNQHIMKLLANLGQLEEFYTNGQDIDDGIWPAVSKLHKLRSLTLNAYTLFTPDGIRGFISSLGPGNHGFSLYVLNADSSRGDFHAENVADLQELIKVKVNGRLDYILYRDEDSSDSDYP
ncbi:MAG: hypothetical protein M1825_004929 [Sarcosagium campestre]|nr:MAG: hypothetical protein M1825_004929 [Sarcosagium campestre]